MLLGPVSLVDCLAFCVLATPQLIWHVGLFQTISALLPLLPFLVLGLPFGLIRDRCRAPRASTPSFAQGCTVFEDLVVRCVRCAFKKLPAHVSRVFFSKRVALPFLQWRMLRHGYLACPVYWREQTIGKGITSTRGLWIMHHPEQPPDVVVYYIHGGGFALGSCYFYLEFLLAWHHLLLGAGHRNPAILALDYDLVPERVYPTQVLQSLQGYRHALDVAGDAAKVCVAGDSAGGTLVLGLLQELGKQSRCRDQKRGAKGDLPRRAPSGLGVPCMAVLISPWVKLKSNLHYPSKVDFVDRRTLWAYAQEYAGAMLSRAPASPGSCADEELWLAASPRSGYFVVYGSEEVFAPEIEAFVRQQERLGIYVGATRFEGGIHAWPVTSLFLSSTEDRRLEGLTSIVRQISKWTSGAHVDGGEETVATIRLDQVNSHG